MNSHRGQSKPNNSSYNRSSKPYDRQSKPYDRQSKPYDRQSKPYDRQSKPYDNKNKYNNKKPYPAHNNRNHSNQTPSYNNNRTNSKKFLDNQSSQQPFKTKHITKGAPSAHQSGLQHLPTIQQMLAIPKEDRLSKSTAIFQQVKQFLTSFMQKKQGSRVTQLLFKWGNQSTKQYIYKEITKSWKELIKSKYALYIIAKVSREFELPGLVEDLQLLQNNREGAQILENFILSNPEAQAVKKLKSRIIQLQSQAMSSNQIKAQQSLDNMAVRSIQKQYYWFQLSKLILRLRLPQMFQEQKQKTIELLSENVASIVNDEEGVRLFIELMNCCSAKDKKNIAKQYKGHLGQIVSANNVSYVSLIKLIIQTDDTVLIVKTFEEELLQLIPQILTCKKAFSIIFSFLSPRNNNFNILGNRFEQIIGKYEPQVTHTTCKKPQDQRKKQVRQELYEPIVEFLKNQENLNTLVKNPVESKLIVGLEKSMQEDHHALYQPYVTLILQHFLKIAKESLENNTFNESILSDGNGSKVLKSLLLIQEDFVEFYCEQMAKLLIKHIKVVVESRASFVLLGILEKGGRDHLVKEIGRSRVQFDKCIAGQHFVKLIEGVTGQETKGNGKSENKGQKSESKGQNGKRK